MDDVGRRTVATITRRLMPLLGLMYLIAYIDRQNVSYAKLQMVGDLGLERNRLRPRRLAVLHRLFPVRGAEQRHP